MDRPDAIPSAPAPPPRPPRESGADGALPWRLTVLGLVFLAGLKSFDVARIHAHGALLMLILSYAQDALLLLLLYAAWEAAAPVRPAALPADRALFLAAYLPLLLSCALYSPFLADLRNFPVNLFAVGADGVRFFLGHFLTPGRAAGTAAWLLALLAAAVFSRVGGRAPSPRLRRAGRAAILLGGLTLLWHAYNPLLHSLKEELRGLLARRRVDGVERLAPPDPRLAGPLGERDRSFGAYPLVTPAYDRVILFVMESIGFEAFAGRREALEELCPGRAGGWRRFTRYHGPNLDSFTALLSILNSVFIPYQAYVNEGKYRFLNGRPNLAGFFRSNGFAAHFVTSYGAHHAHFVPDPADWTGLHFTPELPPEAGYAVVRSNPVEWATEDRAALGPLLDRLAESSRVFALQEMVYGHSPEWEGITGLSPVDYYRDYFRRFFAEAGRRGLLERTLVALCSDHGPREEQRAPGSYHIPLLFWAADLAAGDDDRFLCHLDLKDLLLETVAGRPGPASRPEIWVVGHSGEYLYGRLTPRGGFTLIENRPLAVRSNEPPEATACFHAAFQAYLHAFAGLAARSAVSAREAAHPPPPPKAAP